MTKHPETSIFASKDLYALHDAVIGYTGGSEGLRDAHGIVSAFGNTLRFSEYDGRGPTAAAAKYCEYIARGHYFVDGNKRAAYGALVNTLAMAGYSLDATPAETGQAIVDMIERKIDFVNWVEGHAVIDPVYVALSNYDKTGNFG